MAPARSIACFAPYIRVAGLLGFAAFATVGLRDERATACGYAGPYGVEEMTTFDPKIVGDFDGLYYEPMVQGFGGPCEDCAGQAMAQDWGQYLKGAPQAPDVAKMLAAPLDEITAMRKRAKGNVRAALALIELAKQVEPNASLSADAPPAPELLAEAKLGLKSARDPFIAQRYAYQELRILFYQRNWKGAVAFFDQNVGRLEQPSADLGWRAHHYAAGALRRSGDRARANLELARIHAAYEPIAGEAVEEFAPEEEADWQDALKLAKTVREKTLLWRLVGIRKDGLVAAQEIAKLDPKSNLIALLLVRELAKTESSTYAWDGAPDADAVKAAEKSYQEIEQLATKLAATPGADRPWLMELIAGHIAAKRGRLDAARAHLQKAVAARPDDPRVTSQAKASLAVALAHDWKIDPKREAELATAMNSLDPSFQRTATVTSDIRHAIAGAYLKANRPVDAEFLAPGTAQVTWDVKFIKQMLARTSQNTTEFDKFLLAGGHSREELESELAARYFVEGNFADAAKASQAFAAKAPALGTDPFVIHTIDCHDCDHEKYATAPWTLTSVLEKLAALQKVANGKGEAAAEASYQIANVLYNATWYGNARVMLESTHQATTDTRAAERWYKRAFDLSKNRELKAHAAFMAAKAEQAQLLNGEQYASSMPVPTRWFPVVKTFKDTKYYKEILRECSVFRSWAAK